MVATLINSVSVFIAGMIGFFLKKIISKDLAINLQRVMAVAVIVIGIQSALKVHSNILLIISIAIGFVIGYLLKIEDRIFAFGKFLERKISFLNEEISKGFVIGTVIMGPGAMAMLGAIESGIAGNNSTLYMKTVLDSITTISLTSTLGIGVGFASISIFLFQGTVTLLSSYIEPLVTELAIEEMSAVGGVLIIGIGINMLEFSKKKIKVADGMLAIFIPILYYFIF